MYVCVCRRVTDHQIRDLALEGHSLESIQAKTGAGMQCGTCLQETCNVILDAQAEAPGHKAPVVQIYNASR